MVVAKENGRKRNSNKKKQNKGRSRGTAGRSRGTAGRSRGTAGRSRGGVRLRSVPGDSDDWDAKERKLSLPGKPMLASDFYSGMERKTQKAMKMLDTDIEVKRKADSFDTWMNSQMVKASSNKNKNKTPTIKQEKSGEKKASSKKKTKQKAKRSQKRQSPSIWQSVKSFFT